MKEKQVLLVMNTIFDNFDFVSFFYMEQYRKDILTANVFLL